MIETGLEGDVATYSQLIRLYGEVGNTKEALRIAQKMDKNQYDREAYAALIYLFGLVQDEKKVLSLVEELKSRGIEADSHVYRSLLLSLAKCKSKRLKHWAIEVSKLPEIHLGDDVWEIVWEIVNRRNRQVRHL